MREWAKKVQGDLSDLAEDLLKLLAEREAELAAGKKPSDKINLPKDERLKSLQRVTTFYKDETEARKMAEEDPIVVFIDKRLREIMG